MRFFRSEESLRGWQAAGGFGGAMLPLPQLWALSRRWYAGRLSPEFHGRGLDEIRAIFAAVGLRGAFWEAG